MVAEIAVECGHLVEGDLFGAGLEGEAGGPCGGEDGGVVAGEAEIVGEGLALLGEGLSEQAIEAGGVYVEVGEAGGELEADDGGEDVGRRVRRPRVGG